MQESDQYLLDLQEREKPTLDNFVVGENAEVLAVLREIAAGGGPTFLYLHGPKGVGLTHLLKSLVPEQEYRVPLFSPDVSVYTVDDVEELDPGWCRQLLVLQNAVRASRGAHLVCAGRLPAHRLPLPEDVKSRLVWGLTYAVKPLSEAAQLSELKRQAAERGIDLTDEMLHWMAVHLPRDMRTLSCVLDEADRLGLQEQRRVTLPLLRDAVLAIERRRADGA